jgi:hypothetical protein
MNTIKFMQLGIALAACAAGLSMAWILEARAAEGTASEEDEVTLAWDDLPQAVRATLEEKRPGERPNEIEKETENGKVVYGAEYKVDGGEIEYELSEDGTVLEVETESSDDDDGADDDDDDADEKDGEE